MKQHEHEHSVISFCKALSGSQDRTVMMTTPTAMMTMMLQNLFTRNIHRHELPYTAMQNMTIQNAPCR